MSTQHHQHMHNQSRWPLIGFIPIAFGILWLVSGWHSGLIVGLLASVPGVVLAGAGVSLLMWPGDRLINQWLSLVSAASVLLAIVLVWAFGLAEMLVLIAGGVICVVVGGTMALWQDAVPAEIPKRQITLAFALKAALDEAVIAFFIACSRIPRGEQAQRDSRELGELKTQLDASGWADTPEALHGSPKAPVEVTTERRTAHGRTFEWLAFDSDYAPPPELPGMTQWQNFDANQRVHARVFRHDDGPRPWLMCIHGYRMGTPSMDFSLFHINHLHHRLGLNLIMPILPLHGVRSAGRMSGGNFLDGPMTNLYHAEAQTLRDLRRCLAWLRTGESAANIGVLGYSLGGYNAALLAAFEPALACVIAGIPMTSIADTLWRHMPTVDRRYIEACGLSRARASDLMAPVSPLHVPPRIPRERRYILAGTGDQLIPPAQPLALWHHWDEPAIHWYQGTHLSVRREAGAMAFIDEALENSGMLTSHPTVVTA